MSIRILLVDDHTLFRSGLKALLSRQADFEIVGEASDGLEGVKLAEQLKPDLVLLDLDMPVMNGTEALAQMLAANRELPVVMLTVSEDAEDLKEALAYGLEHAGTDDGGTCNFDSPTLYLPRWNRKKVEAAAKTAGVGCFMWSSFSKRCYVFSVPGVGQGYTRTNAAEAMKDFLKSRGYEAGMYYQMD